jgi:hypothetical protein
MWDTPSSTAPLLDLAPLCLAERRGLHPTSAQLIPLVLCACDATAVDTHTREAVGPEGVDIGGMEISQYHALTLAGSTQSKHPLNHTDHGIRTLPRPHAASRRLGMHGAAALAPQAWKGRRPQVQPAGQPLLQGRCVAQEAALGV